ncbi:hypothetical protein [Streptomyces sp. NPDC051577]|uniref:hypothetical protein n=1 Tax=Streptomyces sp. NPDC051577 TaxID=3155166 RepID=UPI003425C36B
MTEEPISAPDCLFEYTLQPAQAPVSGPAVDSTVDLKLTCHCTQSGELEGISITLPVGAGENQLTTDLSGVEAGKTVEDGWQFEKDDETADSYIAYNAAGVEPVRGFTMTLTLSNVTINRTSGKAPCVITEYSTSPGQSQSIKEIIIPVVKFPENFAIKSFTAQPINVRRGERSSLSWRKGTAAATYHLTCGNQPTGNVNNINQKYTGALYETTVAKLTATTTGAPTLSHALTTLVTVTEPDLTARHLTIEGRTTLVGYIRRLTEYTGKQPLELTTNTDGYLIGVISEHHTASHPDQPVLLPVTITTGHTQQRHLFSTAGLSTGLHPAISVCLLIAAGSTLLLEPAVGRCVHDLTWVPAGSGQLTPT